MASWLCRDCYSASIADRLQARTGACPWCALLRHVRPPNYSALLTSERAVEVNILIMRAFVKLRQLLATHADLARKLAALERKYDVQFKVIFDAIRKLMKPPEPKRRFVGFRKD